ncbi:MAG: HEPN domain-containing protein [Desulfobacteraceae bacterium]|nr:MAG: HEPN domain-containing protein [Desulfobacteraceae bacterium]
MVTLEEAKEVALHLVDTVAPISVIAFGSVATEGQGNDLDLLVVTEQEEMQGEVSASLRSFFKRFAIDCFVSSRAELDRSFRSGSPFLRLVQRQGRVLYMKDALTEWIRLAEEDLREAAYLSKGGFYRGACFAAQQSLEKALKAELLKRGWELERIHSIRRLAAILEGYGLRLQCDEEEIDFLDSIYRGRYPAEEGLLPLKSPGSRDAARAIAAAEKIVSQLPVMRDYSS